MTAQLRRAALDAGLLAMAEDGLRPPCAADPQRWLSDDRAERASAAADCAACPVLAACRESGADEPCGVWGGVDRVPRIGRRPATRPEESGPTDPACATNTTKENN